METGGKSSRIRYDETCPAGNVAHTEVAASYSNMVITFLHLSTLYEKYFCTLNSVFDTAMILHQSQFVGFLGY